MKRILWFLAVWGALTLPGWTSGLMIVHDPDIWHRPFPHPPPVPPPGPPRPIPPPPVWAPLQATFTQVAARIQDQHATTRIEQEFYNPNSRPLEGTFFFPVPRGAHLNKFTMEIEGKPVEAELLAADKARVIYEEIVRKFKDPALLEYAGRDLFKVRIFPVEPRSTKRLRFSYTQLLNAENGLVQYRVPFNTEKFSAQPIKTISLKIEMESSRPLKSIYSPTHRIEVRRHGDHRATAGFEASDAKSDADFQLFFAREQGEVGLSLLTHKTGEEEGYFLLLASPTAETKPGQTRPKDVVFVLDTSGSMAGAKLAQAQKALAFCVENLNQADRFELLRFSSEVESLFGRVEPASTENRERAQAFVRQLKPIGGTAIDDALQKALALRPTGEDRPYLVIFLTDGRPTIGQTDEDQIVAGVIRRTEILTRIFCFGIGTDVNTHLLDRITEDTRAASQYVLPEEDLEIKLSHFFTRIKEPVLTDLKLHFPAGLRVTKMHPPTLPDLFKGDQLVATGRYSGRSQGTIEIEGSLHGESQRLAYDAQFPDHSDKHDFIPRLWATRRVGYLLDEIRLRGEESRELIDEVTLLARQYGIVTPYTAYLIVEEDRQRGLTRHEQLLPEAFYRPEVRVSLSKHFGQFTRERSGDAAVGGARSLQSLKSAHAPSVALMTGNEEALRAFPDRSPISGSVPLAGPAQTGLPALDPSASQDLTGAFLQRTRYVAGRAFFLKDKQWTDSALFGKSTAGRERIPFGSSDYFAWLEKHPDTAPWLALGPSVVFLLNRTIVEIYP